LSALILYGLIEIYAIKKQTGLRKKILTIFWHISNFSNKMLEIWLENRRALARSRGSLDKFGARESCTTSEPRWSRFWIHRNL